MATGRSVSEVKARCKPILARLDLVQLVDEASSPTAAYAVIKSTTDSEDLARAGRWLAVLRRDYPSEYIQLLRQPNSRQATDARQERKLS